MNATGRTENPSTTRTPMTDKPEGTMDELDSFHDFLKAFLARWAREDLSVPLSLSSKEEQCLAR